MTSTEQYPNLTAFIDTYLHQDAELFGNTIDEIASRYATFSRPEEMQKLVLDINTFLAEHGNDLDATYSKLYPNSVIASGYELTTAQMLEQVAGVVNGMLGGK